MYEFLHLLPNDLEFKTLVRNIKKIPDMLVFDGKYPVVYPKAKFGMFFGKKLQKINCETFRRKTYFAQFCEFVSNLLFKIVQAVIIKTKCVTIFNSQQ